MRPMFRTMFVALLAVLALSAVGSASASAAECKHTAKTTTFCIENKPVTGEVGFTASSKNEVIIERPSWSIKMICNTMTDSGIFHAAGGEIIDVTNRVIEITNCTPQSPAHCGVKPIVLGKEEGASGLVGEVSLSGGAFQLDALPAKGQTFGTVTYINNGGTCIIAGTLDVTTENTTKGKLGPICSLPGITAEATEHNMLCASANSHLELGGEPLTVGAEEGVVLSGTNKGKKWSLWEQ